MTHSPIREIDLHAYVDGQLDAARRAEVDAYLAARPDAAAEVQALRVQQRALHLCYDGVMNETVPLRLTGALQPRRWSRGIAAGVVWMSCGIAAGWYSHMLMAPGAAPPTAEFAHQALVAHVLFTAEKRHPVEVSAAQEAHLVAWLSKRLDAPIRAPDLRQSGFALLGGRLLPGDDGPLAQLMYESTANERLTLTVRRASRPQPETGFKVLQQNGTSVFYWIDRDYGYALSGSIGKGRLLAIAHAVDVQLQHE